MRRARKTTLTNAAAISVGGSSAMPRAASSTEQGLGSLFGRKKVKADTRLKQRDLVFILRNLSTLTESGVSLPKALATLAEEKALEKHRDMLHSIRRHLENGETFSSALAKFGSAFDPVMVNQIKVGEHSGILGETLT